MKRLLLLCPIGRRLGIRVASAGRGEKLQVELIEVIELPAVGEVRRLESDQVNADNSIGEPSSLELDVPGRIGLGWSSVSMSVLLKSERAVQQPARPVANFWMFSKLARLSTTAPNVALPISLHV